jgi:hypothetical protein
MKYNAQTACETFSYGSRRPVNIGGAIAGFTTSLQMV